jgi:hypothetical protein
VQFIAPIGFLALAGLIIPVLIHLWNVKQGKTLKIGSIAFLGENATASSKSLKLTDLLLFALRCVVLILIAFLLAQPYLKKTTVTSKNKGWILMDKAKTGETYRVYHKTIDSLLAEGFELRDFSLGFNRFSLKDSTNADEISSGLKYNTLLNQLNKEIPSGYSAYLFADRRVANFDGDFPQLHFNLIWKEVMRNDTLKTWSSTFLGKIYHAKSTPSLTRYSTDVSQNLGTLQVLIYDPKGVGSKYIKAGLNAIADFTKRKIEITRSSSKADILFWLSDQPIVLEKRKPKARLVSYRKGKIEKVNSTFNLPNETNGPIELKRRIAFDNLKGTVIWKDGYGEPLLIKDAKYNNYYFYSRFDPQWSDLVWDQQFVSALLPIILGNNDDNEFGFEDNEADQRILAKMQFSESKNSKSGPSIVFITQNVDYMLWIFAFIVLFIERVIS